MDCDEVGVTVYNFCEIIEWLKGSLISRLISQQYESPKFTVIYTVQSRITTPQYNKLLSVTNWMLLTKNSSQRTFDNELSL